MFRSFSVVVLLIAYGAVFAQNNDPLQDMERNLDWSRFGDRSRSRFGSTILGETSTLDSTFYNFSREFRLGAGSVVPDSSEPPRVSRPLERVPPPSVPSANTPIPVDAADPQHVPIRRPIGFFQRPGVLEPNFILEEPATTPREQRWFRESGGLRPGPRGGSSDIGVGRGALGVGGEEMLHSAANAQETMIRTPTTPTNPPPNPEQVRRKFEERLEGTLLSNPNVHLLSPVRISYNGGIATVRGVVPNQSHKVAVGNILLSDPAVKQVNNMISIVPLDPNDNPPSIEGR